MGQDGATQQSESLLIYTSCLSRAAIGPSNAHSRFRDACARRSIVLAASRWQQHLHSLAARVFNALSAFIYSILF